jgi:hypothetical protein
VQLESGPSSGRKRVLHITEEQLETAVRLSEEMSLLGIVTGFSYWWCWRLVTDQSVVELWFGSATVWRC